MTEVFLTIPGTPPSVNGYVRHTGGRHWVTKTSLRWLETVAALAHGKSVASAKNFYRVEALIVLAKGQRGDTDNFLKLLMDSLVIARVIHSDAAVMEIEVKKSRDWQNPRTEITVKVLPGSGVLDGRKQQDKLD